MRKWYQIFPAAIILLTAATTASAHGLIQNPPSRNWFCGAVTKPDHVSNGTATYPVCGDAFASDFNGGYSFMSVLTHAQGRAAVSPLPQNVCGFNSETWQGRATPWDQPINWPTTNITAGPRTFSWNISWGPHYSDTDEFRYWITKPGFQFQVGRPLAWSDFEDNAFCVLKYNDANPTANANVVADKANNMFHTQCTVPARQGRHVIYAEWGRNQWTYERFHSCVDVAFTASGPDFSVSAPASVNIVRGGSATATVSVARTGGFSGSVAFSVAGLPAGVTGTFNPATTTAGSTVLNLTASSAAVLGKANLTVTATSGALTRTTPIAVDIQPVGDFTLSTSQSSVTLQRGSTATTTVNIARSAGFTGAVNLSASGLPAGVTAVFNPSSATGATTSLTLTASSTAATGPVNVTITGNSGAISRTTPVSVTITDQVSPSFTLSASSAPVNLKQGGSGTTNIIVGRTGGFSGPVTLSAIEVPTGITASFAPAVVTGGNAVLTLSASTAAITGAGTVRVTGSSNGSTVQLTVPFVVESGSQTGKVSIAPVVNVNQPWYNEVALKVTATAPITALSVSINIQRTPGVSYAGQYNTVGGQIQQSNTVTPTAITYKYTLAPGQTLGTDTYRMFAAQASGSGTAHPTAGDTYTVVYTVGGSSFTETGHF